MPGEKTVRLPSHDGSLEAVGHHVGQSIVEVAAALAALGRESIQKIARMQAGSRTQFQQEEPFWQGGLNLIQRRKDQGCRVLG